MKSGNGKLRNSNRNFKDKYPQQNRIEERVSGNKDMTEEVYSLMRKNANS